MHCLLVIGTWECLVFDFNFFFVESCHFMCLSVMRFFLVTSGSIFDHSVWLILFFDVLIFIHLFNSNGVVVVALANLRWCVFCFKVITNW